MRQKAIGMLVSIVLTTFALVALSVDRAGAETVLEKISRTGKFTAGTRTSSIPFAFINEKKEWVGFSVDLIKEIHRRLERNLVKKIKLDLKKVTPKTRIPLVVNRTIDIECGSTTYTRSRDEAVDFSINFFFTGGQLLIKKESGIKAARDLMVKANSQCASSRTSSSENTIESLRLSRRPRFLANAGPWLGSDTVVNGSSCPKDCKIFLVLSVELLSTTITS